MAGSVNKVILVGNLGGDPEIKVLPNGNKVANFSLATSESWKDKNTGEKKERTEWHRVVVWSEGLISVIEQYVKKGDKVYLEGVLQTRKWEKDGVDHYSTEVVLTGFSASLVMLGSAGGGGDRDPNGNSSRPGNGGGGARPGANRSSAPAFETGGQDDDIPF